MNHDERLAQRIVQAAMPDLQLDFISDQSKSVADFSMRKGGIDYGILEVTRFTDQIHEELRKEIRKAWFIERKHCKSDWMIYLGREARVKRVRECADQYLREIEKDGMDEFFSALHSRYESVRSIWDDLSIEAGKVKKWKCPGIGMTDIGSGGFARPETVWASVKQEVWKDDNRSKLNKSCFAHRHLFIVIEGFQGPAYVSIRNCEPPNDVPELPTEITHLWVAAEEGCLVYVWRADSNGWLNLSDKINRIHGQCQCPHTRA
ncbi:MAG: hypothetical protein OXR64_07265 [Chloroflexota bacterium]|nr:hypothetical protein [Chloroflexota bacterium]MDE2919631.1 hypothetical protein [Chloroflexota bacterium]